MLVIKILLRAPVRFEVNFTLKYGIGFFTPAIAEWLTGNYSLNHVFWFFAFLSCIAFFCILLNEK